MTEVYVIVFGVGDRDERKEWVAGVFTDKSEAIRIAEEKLNEYKAVDVAFYAWIDSYILEHSPLAVNNSRRYSVPADVWFNKRREMLNGVEEADDYKVVEAPINVFGRWDNEVTEP